VGDGIGVATDDILCVFDKRDMFHDIYTHAFDKGSPADERLLEVFDDYTM